MTERRARALSGTGERRHVEDRHARLTDERLENLIDRLPGRCGDRLPEILGRRVAVGMGPQIRVDAVAERRGAHVVLDHPNDGGALLVGNRVEQGFDFGGRPHGSVDGVRRAQ